MITTIREYKQLIKEGSTKEVTLVAIRSKSNSIGSDDFKLHIKGNKVKQLIKTFANYYIKDMYTTETVTTSLGTQTFHRVLIAQNDRNFRSEGLTSQAKKELKDELLGLGYTLGYPKDYVDFRTQEHEQYKINYEKERKEKGYVCYKYDSSKMTTKELIGGFDLNVIFEEALISYIEKGLTFGYIGHSCRKIWVDQMLSRICLDKIKNEDFANWLTSTGGRHFGDNIEGMVENDDKAGVEKYIKDHLATIHDQAIIYNSPDHQGTYGSTIALFNKYKELGLMMGNTVPGF